MEQANKEDTTTIKAVTNNKVFTEMRPLGITQTPKAEKLYQQRHQTRNTNRRKYTNNSPLPQADINIATHRAPIPLQMDTTEHHLMGQAVLVLTIRNLRHLLIMQMAGQFLLIGMVTQMEVLRNSSNTVHRNLLKTFARAEHLYQGNE